MTSPAFRALTLVRALPDEAQWGGGLNYHITFSEGDGHCDFEGKGDGTGCGGCANLDGDGAPDGADGGDGGDPFGKAGGSRDGGTPMEGLSLAVKTLPDDVVLARRTARIDAALALLEGL